MNDRRLILALLLIMVIAFLPTFLVKRKASQTGADSLHLAPPSSASATAVAPGAMPAQVRDTATSTASPARTIPVRSSLYRFGISTHGGEIVSSRFLAYRSMYEPDHRDTLELLQPGDGLLASTLIAGTDTLHLDRIDFTASSDSLAVRGGPATLTLHGTSGNYSLDLRYTFAPDDYRIDVSEQIAGLGPAGATLVVGLGNGFRNTEANPAENWQQSGVVTKLDKTSLTAFGKLHPQVVSTFPGPFEWVAVKSKYFVVSLFDYDSTGNTFKGGIGGAQALSTDTNSHPVRAHVAASVAVPASGVVHWQMYIGPMEYDRLSRMGHDFDDVNPYGWSWLRWLIRPIAVYIRAVFVWMHHSLGLGYGLVIILFGIIIRVVLWPLNRVAMRSMARMQAIQPQLAALQERYKEDPQQLQQETFRLYRENKVNPFGGCWPMLIPYPFLLAVFFVIAYTIELRGVGFLWMTDLSRPDPIYLVPIVMAVSMFATMKIGQIGLPANPQSKMTTWMMPAVMLLVFARFASGVNVYYTVQNLASIPQQWLVVKERRDKAEGKKEKGKGKR